jgi:prevent-host-death family protein
MKSAPLSDVKAHLADYLKQCAKEGPVIITRNGKAVGVLVAPVDKEDLERLMLARSPKFRALLEKSRRSVKAGKGLSREEFWKAVEQRSRKRPAPKPT